MQQSETERPHLVHTSMSTGLPSLDAVLRGVQPGDNIVWQVDSIADYVPFVHKFCQEANREGRPLIYFRFADHEQLMPPGVEANVFNLQPEKGFEPFISGIFEVIERFGAGTCYVFDCLSELSADWYSDRMLGNFFMLTCPYLYDYDTATFFALLRNRNMAVAINAIHNTAQVVLDVYNKNGTRYIHPIKVWKRYSPTMYMLHRMDGEGFSPVTASAVIADIMTSVPQPWLDFTIGPLDIWTRTFSEARQYCSDALSDQLAAERARTLSERLLRMMVTRDDRLLALARSHLGLCDLVNIGKRMIGTGLIGGKSSGMLIARAILEQSDPRWRDSLERHDSFFIGSDVFYTYLVQNGCWWLRRRLIKDAHMLDSAEDARQRLLRGAFPDDIREQFAEMLEYFGQSPIIVRSSSLLEDAYGNSFSGKYESVFCANQGTPGERLDKFMDAVRTVYASTMESQALAYRAHWGLLDMDEQMAILVQRVSGETHGNLFYPQLAGVAFSYNPYVWNKEIDPHAGVLRLVFGLGTRAVDRADDDYTRVVALNAPSLRAEANLSEVRRYAQRHVDLLDLSANELVSRNFEDVAGAAPELPLDLFAPVDEEMERRARDHGMSSLFARLLTFEDLLGKTTFAADMRALLTTLENAYRHPVDVEFTAHVFDAGRIMLNLVQCRPFQVKGQTRDVRMPRNVAADRTILATDGPVIGNSLATRVSRIVYVVPSSYSSLTVSGRYAIARLVGRVTHAEGAERDGVIVLIGPGRWGTTTPSLGVPVTFAEINTVRVLCEVAEMHEGLIPDVSLGTHFFNDLVEMDMLCLAVYPRRPGSVINADFLTTAPNRLPELLPDAKAWSETVRVIDPVSDEIILNVNSIEQRAIMYLERAAAPRRHRRAKPKKQEPL